MTFDKKISNLLFITLTLLVGLGCGAQKDSATKGAISAIEIEKTPCFGQCPVYVISFEKGSNMAEFTGKIHTDKQGKYKKQLTEEEKNWVMNTFSPKEWMAFDTLYPTAYSDLPSTIIRLKYNKSEVHTIVIKEGGPIDLIKYINRVNELAIKSGGWINLNLE